jgi:hypothetical protein
LHQCFNSITAASKGAGTLQFAELSAPGSQKFMIQTKILPGYWADMAILNLPGNTPARDAPCQDRMAQSVFSVAGRAVESLQMDL